MKNFLALLLFMLTCLSLSCVKKKNSIPAAETQSAGDLSGFDDLDAVRFNFGKSESTHLFSPATASINDLNEPVKSEEIEAAFLHAIAPVVRDAVAKEMMIMADPIDMIPSIAGGLSDALKSVMKNVNASLNGPRYVINYGFLPFKSRAALFADNGFAFSGMRTQEGAASMDGFFKNVVESMKFLQVQGFARKDTLPNYLLGSILNVVLVKNASYATFQLAIGLNPKRVKFFQDLPEAELHEAVIPSPKTADASTVMLLNIRLDLAKETPPVANISFGALQSIEDASVSEFEIKLRPPTGDNPSLFNIPGALGWKGMDCAGSHASQPFIVAVPKLSKVISPNLKNVDLLASVDLRFRELALNVETSQLTDLRLGQGRGPNAGFFRFTLGCVVDRKVDAQIKDELNNTIATQLSKVQGKGQDLITALIMGARQ